MKKISVIFFAAIAMLTVASCAKEELAPNEPGIFNGKTNFITVAVSLSEDTKTGLSLDGKTVTWAYGDSLLVTDGSKKCAVYIPEEYDGQKTATIKIDGSKVDSTKQLYAVYPYAAFSKIDGGKIVVNVPTEQSGEFAAANISVAKMDTTYKFAMKNVASIFKVTIADDISTLMISGGKADTLAAALTVDYTDADTPVSITKTSPVKSVRLAVGGIGGDYYVAVVPGTYSTELSMLAVTADGQSEKVSATKAHTLAINDIADLGRIGDNPAGAKFDGDGTEESPYLIKTSADMTVLANAVNNGVDYAGVFFKVADNISGVETPVGTYDGTDFYFKGTFDGNGKTITLAMGGEDCTDGNLGLFGDLGEGACIKNVNVAGTVATTGKMVGGIAGCVNAGAGATIENCTNAAIIKGGDMAGGFVGYGDGILDIKNCTNSGSITGDFTTAGIVGYAYSGLKISNCTNSAAITANDGAKAVYQCVEGYWKNAEISDTKVASIKTTYHTSGVGGIAGWLQASNIESCTNSGAITGTYKVAGISGSSYWSTIKNSNNAGLVTASGLYAGGIIGWAWGHSINENCTNTAEVTGNAFVGGIVGLANFVYSNNAQGVQVLNCSNSGNVFAVGKTRVDYYNAWTNDVSAAGGLVGGFYPGYNKSNKRAWLWIKGSKNTGVVSATELCAGGLLGAYFGINNCNWDVIENSLNSGEVSAKYWAGGLLGYWNGRWNYDKTYIRNCGNTGKVTGTRTDGANCVVGGLVGGSYVTYSATTYADFGAIVTNCYNHGDVVYQNDTLKTIYAGGLTGFNWDGTYSNCYTTAKVTSSTGSIDPEATLYGALVAYLAGRGAINTCYYLEGVAPLAIGEGSTNQPGTYVVPFTMSEGVGTFDVEKPGYADNEDLLTALNAYATANKYVQWKASDKGPVLDL